MSTYQQDHTRRFSSLAKLYGEGGLAKIIDSHVVVIGVGGVGSWTVESLARSAVGELTLIDLDHLAESNVNRQLPAIDSTLGQAKVQALKARIGQINQRCKVHCIEAFISEDNIVQLLGNLVGEDNCVVVDCIDHAKTKASLIAWCRQQKLAIVTVGAAGACIDPTRIKIDDLSRTENDLLLARTRKHLRQLHHYPRNQKRRFYVPAVYSDEARIASEESTDQTAGGGLNCAGYGSVAHVTAGIGFAAAGKVLNVLTN